MSKRLSPSSIIANRTLRENTTDYADNVAQVVSTPRIDVLKNANFEDYQSQVQSFYEARNYELAWTREGKPTSEATAMIQLFTDAANKGLRPEDYDASRWPQLVQELKSYGSSSSDDAQTKVRAIRCCYDDLLDAFSCPTCTLDASTRRP